MKNHRPTAAVRTKPGANLKRAQAEVSLARALAKKAKLDLKRAKKAAKHARKRLKTAKRDYKSVLKKGPQGPKPGKRRPSAPARSRRTKRPVARSGVADSTDAQPALQIARSSASAATEP
jgi:hypothetical protein